jgi:hypothetical protein
VADVTPSQQQETCRCGAHKARGSQRCSQCHDALRRDLADAQRAVIVAMWSEGRLCREIGEALGWSAKQAAAAISRIRRDDPEAVPRRLTTHRVETYRPRPRPAGETRALIRAGIEEAGRTAE